MNQLVALIVDESKWLAVSMCLAVLAVAVMLWRRRRADISSRRRIAAAMSLFFAVTTMAFGHLLAVTTKLAVGTLAGSAVAFYAIGVALAAPSWWLAFHAPGILYRGDHGRRTTLVLNGWLTLTLVALGVHNLPLAMPGLLNIAYQLHSRRAVGWVVASVAAVLNAGLFVGSLIFLASGQSFEQFKGLE
jgi:hypothetical protein